MNKAELIDAMANNMSCTKSDAESALNAFLEVKLAALCKGEKISIPGHGSFEVTHRAARQGRNPQTGATIQIAASTSAKWKPGKAVKDALAAANV